MKDPAGCGRPNVKTSSAICDPENILTKENQDVIEGFINAVPTTSAQIAVVIIRSMDTKFIGSSTIEAATEKFARSLHDAWGVGSSETQNGILLFLSLTSRSVFISTGDGVKGKLSQAILEGYIINEVMKPELKHKYYSSAIEKAVFEMDNILSGKSNISAMYYNASSWIDNWFVKTGGFMGIFAFVLYWSWREGERMRKLERGRRALDELMTEVTWSNPNPNPILQNTNFQLTSSFHIPRLPKATHILKHVRVPFVWNCLLPMGRNPKQSIYPMSQSVLLFLQKKLEDTKTHYVQ